MQLFDTHAHYNDEKFDIDRENVIEQIYNSGVTKLVNAGYSLESSKRALEIAKKYEWMYVIFGISPNDIPNSRKKIDEQVLKLKEMIKNEATEEQKIVKDVDNEHKNDKKMANKKRKIVAIGEIGLDYYWNKENKDLQKYAFIKQIELANELELPIVIHTRDAVYDTLEILKGDISPIKKGIFHCCPLNKELVKEAVKLGFYISFAGPVTFKNSKNADEVINLVPLDKILIETDSPYLSPEPNRGKRNDSRNIRFIAEKIANAAEETNLTYTQGFIICYVESDFAKNAYNQRGKAYGLCQITQPCLSEYNWHNGTNYTLDQIIDPDLNLKIGFWYYHRLLTHYKKYTEYGIHDFKDAYIAYNLGVTAFKNVSESGRISLRNGIYPCSIYGAKKGSYYNPSLRYDKIISAI